MTFLRVCILAGSLLSFTSGQVAVWAAQNPDVSAQNKFNNFSGNAEVKGFRSARFGMTEDQVMKAIHSDFKISKKKIKREINPAEKTANLLIAVPDLIQEIGLARIGYMFGYRSKKLMQVDILWGSPINPNPNFKALVDNANLLRNHLARKGFRKDKLVMNARLEDGSILVFRGTDLQGRMALLLLKNSQDNIRKKEKKQSLKKVGIVKAKAAILREGPGKNFKKVAVAKKGDRFEIVETTSSIYNNYPWLKVSDSQGKTSYIWGGLVTFTQSETKENLKKEMSLRLYYIENPISPDIFKLDKDDF